MPAYGTKLPNGDVRSTVAIGGKPDMTRTAQFGREDPNRTLPAPRRELWYPPSNAMGRFNEAADPQMALAAARAERARVLRLHTDLKIALPGLEEDQRREAGLRPHRLWRDGLHWPSHRRISGDVLRSEEHTSELQSQSNLVCRLLLEKKKKTKKQNKKIKLKHSIT